jgi:hypothetical protein
VFNGQDSDLPDVVIDTVDHPVVAAACAVQPAEAELVAEGFQLRLVGSPFGCPESR